MPKIFISYSRVDRVPFTDLLVDHLRRVYGHGNVWYDDELRGGDRWWQEILDQVKACDIFIYLLSNDSVNSPYCYAEFTEARRLQKRIITVQVRDRTNVPQELDDIQYVDMKNGADDANALTRLYSAVNKQSEQVSRKRPLWNTPTLRPNVPSVEEERANPVNETQTLEIPHAPQTAATTSPVAKSQSRSWLMGVAGLVAMAIIALGIAYVAGVFDGENGESGNDATEETEVANVPSESPTLTETVTESPSDTPTNTPEPSSTHTATLTFTPSDTPTATDTLVPIDTRAFTLAAMTIEAATANQQATEAQYTFTPTPSYTSTSTATDTPDIAASEAAALANLYATQTAEAWTDTPTVTLTPTPTVTFTATTTLTPTITLTPSVTNTPVPLGFPGNPVSANDQWQPIEQDFDGVTMVLVPVGLFKMGSEDSEEDESPAHPQQFDQPFWIDKYEVTRAQYVECVVAGVCSTTLDNEYSTGDDQPINYISWIQSYDYCEWRGERLPTEREWEYAARGPDNLLYPWGDDFVADHTVYGDNSGTQTAAVGSKSDGISWVGALDMSGNVWEWTESIYMAYPYVLENDTGSNISDNTVRVLRGGSAGDGYYQVRAVFRIRNSPMLTGWGVGVRCARDYQPTDLQ